ncbi:MAG: tetratricopeptide repeat protein [Bacteroidales bacterium]|nr:tetratricopeptide repeat protein [Candidatus Colimorpha onthohippi]
MNIPTIIIIILIAACCACAIWQIVHRKNKKCHNCQLKNACTQPKGGDKQCLSKLDSAIRSGRYKKKCLALLVLCIIAPKSNCQTCDELVQKGLAAERQNLMERAESYYRQGVATDSCAAACLHLGILLESREQWAEATQWLERDSSVDGYSHIAHCWVELEMWDSARSAAERAIELGGTASPMTTMAAYESAKGHQIPALSWVNKALKADSRYARAENMLGVILFRKGQDNEALTHFRKAVDLDPNDIDAYYNLGMLYALRDNGATAVTHLKKGLRLHPRSIKLWNALGKAYNVQHNSDKALACYAEVLKLDSTNLHAYISMGNIHCDVGNYDQALAYFKKATLIKPSSPDGYKGLGRTYTANQDYRKAVQAYIRASQADPTDATTYLMMADLYHKQANDQKEKNSYKKAAHLGSATAQQWCVKHGIAW